MEAPSRVFQSAGDDMEHLAMVASRGVHAEVSTSSNRDVVIWRTFQIVSLIGFDIAVLLILRSFGY